MTLHLRAIGASSLPDTAVATERGFGSAVVGRDEWFGQVQACERYQATPEEEELLRSYTAAVEKAWRRIIRERDAGNHAEAHRAARQLLTSRKLAYWAANHVLRRSRPRQRRNYNVATLAGRARDWNVLGGRANARSEAKAGGGYRTTYAYSLIDRTRQIILAKSLGMLVRFHPKQTGVPGQGTHDAALEVLRLIKTGRYASAIELDISNFFGTVDAGWIADRFRMPAFVRREVLTNQGKEERGDINFSLHTDRRDIIDNRSHIQPLPQGASSSPIFAYGLIKPIMEEFERAHPEVAIISNCDNFLLMAPTQQVLEEGAVSLISMFAEHSAGGLLVRRKSPLRRLADGIDYLGLRFVKRKRQPVIQSIPRKAARYRQRLLAKIREINNPTVIGPTREERVSEAALFALHNLPAFKLAVDDFHDLLSFSWKCLQRYPENREVRSLKRYDRTNVPEKADSIENSLGDGTNHWDRNVLKWGGLNDGNHQRSHSLERYIRAREVWRPTLHGPIVPRSPTAHIPCRVWE